MDYKSLFDGVAANLADNQHFAVQVETTRSRRGEIETKWTVYVQRDPESLFAEGCTAQDAFDEFLRLINPREQETLADTSESVGDAEVAS